MATLRAIPCVYCKWSYMDIQMFDHIRRDHADLTTQDKMRILYGVEISDAHP